LSSLKYAKLDGRFTQKIERYLTGLCVAAHDESFRSRNEGRDLYWCLP